MASLAFAKYYYGRFRIGGIVNMRVVVWGINFAPELTGIAPFNTGLCDYLHGRGHQVEVVTAFPYYPFWEKIPSDSRLLYRTDDLDGVPVHRCWHFVPRRVTTLKRIWHELSFGITSFFRLLFIARPDIYVVISPPLILGLFASMLGWIKRRPFVFHVQDLQPDAAIGLGMVKGGCVTRLLYRIEGCAYRRASLVGGISEGMMRAYERKGVPEEKRMLFPNWLRSYARNVSLSELEMRGPMYGAVFREKFHINKETFLASYSGNLGKKQGLETLLQAAKILQRALESQEVRGGELTTAVTEKRVVLERGRRDVVILIIGDGAIRPKLETCMRELGLTNIRMMPLLIEADYRGMLAASDVSLILQAAGTGQYFFPSKLLSILAARSPVLSVADEDSELARAVAEGSFGVNVQPDRPAALAAALADLAQRPEQIELFRENTRWVDRFSAPNVLGEFERRLQAVVERFA